MTKLKPCPFCGSKPYGPIAIRDLEVIKLIDYIIGCDECPVQICLSQKREVIRAWNRRVKE